MAKTARHWLRIGQGRLMEKAHKKDALEFAQLCLERWGTLRDVVATLHRDIDDTFAALTPELRLEEAEDNCLDIADSWIHPHVPAARAHVFFDLDSTITEEDHERAATWHSRGKGTARHRGLLSYEQKVLSIVLTRLAHERWKKLESEEAKSTLAISRQAL